MKIKLSSGQGEMGHVDHFQMYKELFYGEGLHSVANSEFLFRRGLGSGHQ